MKKILIALDYDPSAQKIAEAGFLLAKSMNAEATLLHIIADPVYYSSTIYDPIMGFGGYSAIDLLPEGAGGMTEYFKQEDYDRLISSGYNWEVPGGEKTNFEDIF